MLSKPSGMDQLYGLVLALGGLAGYASARSTVSLVMGVGSGLIVTVANHGLWSLVLAVAMGRRFVNGGSFMPSGFGGHRRVYVRGERQDDNHAATHCQEVENLVGARGFRKVSMPRGMAWNSSATRRSKMNL